MLHQCLVGNSVSGRVSVQLHELSSTLPPSITANDVVGTIVAIYSLATECHPTIKNTVRRLYLNSKAQFKKRTFEK